jgi:hypothetical protein
MIDTATLERLLVVLEAEVAALEQYQQRRDPLRYTIL